MSAAAAAGAGAGGGAKLFAAFAAEDAKTAAAAAADAKAAAVTDFKACPKVAVVKDGKFRLQIASDLHLEMFRDKSTIYRLIKPAAPYLALLGDIGCPGISGNATGNGLEILRPFLAHVSTQFDKVFFIAGNHEYYIHSQPMTIPPKTVRECDAVISAICKELKNVYYLTRNSEAPVVDGVRLIGCTLWSHVPTDALDPVGLSMNDYNLCYTEKDPNSKMVYPWKLPDAALPKTTRRLHVSDTNAWHAQDLAFIDAQLRAATAAKQSALVLTHHAPLMTGTSNPSYDGTRVPVVTVKGAAAPQKFKAAAAAAAKPNADAKAVAQAKAAAAAVEQDKSTEPDSVAHAFASALDYVFDSDTNPEYRALKGWGYGHTHWCVDRAVNGIPVVANQRGYEPNEVAKVYRPDFVIAIDIDFAARPNATNKAPAEPAPAERVIPPGAVDAAKVPAGAEPNMM